MLMRLLQLLKHMIALGDDFFHDGTREPIARGSY